MTKPESSRERSPLRKAVLGRLPTQMKTPFTRTFLTSPLIRSLTRIASTPSSPKISSTRRFQRIWIFGFSSTLSWRIFAPRRRSRRWMRVTEEANRVR
ncbi:MAG: hypothetical protein QHH30_05910 [candidate division NC10 bacterium]|nr:hypothetical protein [candidate division NC10 bacterium]